MAEFVALRQEIERRSIAQHALFALQLTSSGAIFSFAFTGAGHIGFLLIIPISTYMLCARYIEQQYGIQRIARYIKDELDGRVPGGLRWEAWQVANARFVRGSTVRRFNALMMMFPLIGFAALLWTSGTAFGGAARLSAVERTGFDALWVFGLLAVAVSFQLIWNMLRHPLGDAPVPPIYRLPEGTTRGRGVGAQSPAPVTESLNEAPTVPPAS